MKYPDAPAVTREAEEDWARWLVASARSSALGTNGTSRIWSNSQVPAKASEQLFDLSQEHIRPLIGLIDRLNEVGAEHELTLLWQILSGTGFPNQFFCDSWVVGFGGADHGWKDVGLERRAWTLSQAVCGSVGSQGAATNVSTLRVGADRSWRS